MRVSEVLLLLLFRSAAVVVALHDLCAPQDFGAKKNAQQKSLTADRVVQSCRGYFWQPREYFEISVSCTLLSKLFLPSPPVSLHSRRRSLAFFFSLSPPSNRIQIPQAEFFPPSEPSVPPPPLLRGCEKPRCTLIVPARSSIRPLITRSSTGAVNHCQAKAKAVCIINAQEIYD